MKTIIVNETNGVLDFDAGTEIDTYERVVRVNSGFGIEGYHYNIGTKVDVIATQPVFFASEIKRNELQSRAGYEDVKNILLLTAWRQEILNDEYRALFPGKEIEEIGEALSTFAYRSTRIPTHYTAYLAALHYSLMGDEVTVYGLNPDKIKHFWEDYTIPQVCHKTQGEIIAIEVEDLKKRGVQFLEDKLKGVTSG